jgi:hypothetical protein
MSSRLSPKPYADDFVSRNAATLARLGDIIFYTVSWACRSSVLVRC